MESIKRDDDKISEEEEFSDITKKISTKKNFESELIDLVITNFINIKILFHI